MIELKQDMRLAIASRQEAGFVVRYLEPEVQSYHKCSYCHDLLGVHFEACKPAGPNPPVTKKPIFPIEGVWYIVYETFSFPCPYCVDPSTYAMWLWSDSGLEQQHRSWSINFIKGQEGKQNAFQAAMAMQMEVYPSGLMLLYGKHGVGKSGVLKSLVAHFISRNIPARYVRAADLLSELRSTYNDDSLESEDALLDKYLHYKLLALDELDVISNTPWAESQLRNLIDKRYENRMLQATVMATNALPDEIWPYLSSRCEDGLRILMAGESLRGAPAQTGNEWWQA